MATRRLVLHLLASSVALAGKRAVAQAWPAKPLRLVVGYPPGGGVDSMARLLAARLSPLLGQQIVVDNRGGAAGLIAADHVANAAADGYTLLAAESSIVIAPHVRQRLSFDPFTSFTSISGLFTMPLVIVVNNDFPATTPAEFVAQLKAAPGRYSYATSGVGQVQHLGFELFKERTGTVLEHVPYRGAAQIIPDIIGGQVPIGVMSISAALPQVKAAKLKAIALMSPVKPAGAEAIPVLADILPGFDTAPRLYLAAPAGLSVDIASRLDRTIRDVMTVPDLAGIAASQGAVPAYQDAEALAVDLRRESGQWAGIASTRKITVD